VAADLEQSCIAASEPNLRKSATILHCKYVEHTVPMNDILRFGERAGPAARVVKRMGITSGCTL